jgi:ElaB/YqjD/DUF883 family membrane-anchored ribosome-binding protein
MGASAAATGNDEGGSSSATDGVAGAKAAAGELQEKVTEKVSDAVEVVRGKTGNMQATVADWLDSSAQAIRSRGSSAADAADGGAGDAAVQQLAQTRERAAALLERSAMWLRENDLSDVEARLKTQLEEHPARTLLLAAGVGFLVSRRRS